MCLQLRLLLYGCTNPNLASHSCFIMGCAWQHQYVIWYCSLSRPLHYPIYAFLWPVSIQLSVISWLWAVGALGCCLHLIEAEWNGSIYQRRLNQEVCMCESVYVCVFRDRQPWEIRARNCLWLQAVSLFLSLTRRCFSPHAQAQILDRSNILVSKQYIHTVYQPVTVTFPPLRWLQTSWSHISSVAQQAGGLESVSRLLSFKCRFTSCVRQELRCLFRMRSA